MQSQDELKRAICEHALGLGFCAVGIASPQAAQNSLPHLQQWLATGEHADLHYLARQPERRVDATSLFPGCKSVLVAAASYAPSIFPAVMDNPPGIAKYALGLDYHAVLRDRLEQLLAFIQSQVPDVKGGITVDTSPIMEKAFAVAAGIGWQGRHTIIIHPDCGSYILLGLLLLDLDLPPDAPHADRCGSCTRCLDACPTQALVAPGFLRVERCISYITTARKRPVAPAEQLHGWIYGCDACQDACPYNQRARPGGLVKLRSRYETVQLQRESLLALDEAAFARQFRGTVIGERGYALFRAACIADAAQRQPD